MKNEIQFGLPRPRVHVVMWFALAVLWLVAGGCRWGFDFNPDGDGDGHATIASGGDDCDDGSPNVYPGALEICDGLDNDCDQTTDELGYGFLRMITIDHTKVAGSSDLEDFPLLISFSSDDSLKTAAIGGHVQGDQAQDILFKEPGACCGCLLDFEIERYDSSSGTLAVWVRLPSLSPTQDTQLWMLYGKAGAVSQATAPNVWSKGYQAVWHLAQSGSDVVLDSTAQGYNGAQEGTVYDGAGKIGGARHFDSSQTSKIMFETSRDLLSGWSAFAFELWLYPDYASDSEFEEKSEGKIIHKGGSFALGRIYRHTNNPPNLGNFQIDITFAGSGTQYSSVSVRRQIWNHVVFVFDGSTFRAYTDGMEQFSFSFGADRLADSTEAIRLGDDGDKSFQGMLDEVRISKVGRTSAWITTEYANQNDPSSFLSVGAEQSGHF